MKVHEVPLELLSDFWPLAAPHLARAVKHNPHIDLADAFTNAASGFSQLIIVLEGGECAAAAVMERVRYPKHVVGNIMLLGGNAGTMGARLDALVDHLFRWAKARGCDRIALLGRPGFERLVRRRGGSSITLIHAWRDI
jgi:hypothetical protein